MGDVWRVGVVSQRVNTQPVSGARFSLFLFPTHFSFHFLNTYSVWCFSHPIDSSFDIMSLSRPSIWFLFSLFFFVLLRLQLFANVFIYYISNHTRAALYYLACCARTYSITLLSDLHKARGNEGLRLSHPATFCGKLYSTDAASHSNCSQVCYSAAFWTCGLACLAEQQAALLARRVYAGAHRPAGTLEGLYRAAYPAVLEEAAYMRHLMARPRKGISSGYWKWNSKGFEAKTSRE